MGLDSVVRDKKADPTADLRDNVGSVDELLQSDVTTKVEAANHLDSRYKRMELLNAILTDSEKRSLGHENFRFFLNLLSYNWLNKSPDDWHPLPDCIVSDHHQCWHNLLHYSDDAYIILGPRKHGKSTWAYGEMLHGLQYNERFEIFYWANTQGQISSRMTELEEVIEENQWLNNCHKNGDAPKGLDKDFPNGGKVHTASTGTSPEGSHVHLSIGDDVEREIGGLKEIMDWHRRVVVPMRNEDGKDVIVGTRKRPDDLYSKLRDIGQEMENVPSYRLMEYPALREVWEKEYNRPDDLAPEAFYQRKGSSDGPGSILADKLDIKTQFGGIFNVLWPESRSLDFLLSYYGRQGMPAFLREFCMVYVEAEGSIVQRQWVDECSVAREPPLNIVSSEFVPAPHGPGEKHGSVSREWFDRVVTGIDPAGEGTDKFAFVTIGRRGKYRHILDVFAKTHMTPSEFRTKFDTLYERYRPDQMILEGNLNQTWVAEDEEFSDFLPLKTVGTTTRKHSWKEGVPRIASDLETGVYRFYVKRRGDDDETGELIDALTSLSMDGGELTGHTPDTVMAMYKAHKGLKSFGSDIVDVSDVPKEQREKQNQMKDEQVSAVADLGGSPLGDAILNQRKQL